MALADSAVTKKQPHSSNRLGDDEPVIMADPMMTDLMTATMVMWQYCTHTTIVAITIVKTGDKCPRTTGRHCNVEFYPRVLAGHGTVNTVASKLYDCVGPPAGHTIV